MHNGKSMLAIIPARAGSRRLANKNTRLFAGKPLIHWTLEAAQRSRVVDEIIVTTDGPDIARVCVEAKQPVPWLRPAHLATDEASVMDVIEHALRSTSRQHDFAILLQPTSPLRRAEDIDACVAHCLDNNFDAAVSVCRLPKPASFFGFLEEDDKFTKPAEKGAGGVLAAPRLAGCVMLNGAVYVGRTDHLLKHRSFYCGKTGAYIMPEERSFDIDTEYDFQVAEFVMHMQNGGSA